MKKTTQFRRLIEAEEILVQPGVYDGLSESNVLMGLDRFKALEQKYGTAAE